MVKLTGQYEIDVNVLVAEVAHLKRVIEELEADKRVLEARLQAWDDTQ